MKLEGRIALVTGGSRGIGRAICLSLAAQGAVVGVNYRSGEAEAAEVVRLIQEGGGRAAAMRADVSEFSQAEALVAQCVEQLGGLHIVVNNAGISKDALV